MAIHPAFPTSPYEPLNPKHQWFPAEEDLRDSAYDKLVPPLVNKFRREVKEWRENGYESASATSKALLNWWFPPEFPSPKGRGVRGEGFQYYFSSPGAVCETSA